MLHSLVLLCFGSWVCNTVLSAPNSWIFCVIYSGAVEAASGKRVSGDRALNKITKTRPKGCLCLGSLKGGVDLIERKQMWHCKVSWQPGREKDGISKLWIAESQKRSGQVRVLKMEQAYFQPYKEPDADEEETVTGGRAAPLPSQDPRALWLGFPMDPTHHSAHSRWFFLLLQRSTVVLELSSQTHSQKLAQWQSLLANREKPQASVSHQLMSVKNLCVKIHFLINPLIFLGKIIYKLICNDYSKWLAGVCLCWKFHGDAGQGFFSSPGWVCRAGRETKIPWGCAENLWGRHTCKSTLPKQFLLSHLIYRRPEGNSTPIYEPMGQKKSSLRLFKKSQGPVGKCCPVQVAKCSQDELAKLHLPTTRGCKDRMVQPIW